MKEAKLKVISFSNSDVIATSGLQWGHVSLKGSPRYYELEGDEYIGFTMGGYSYETSNYDFGEDYNDVRVTTYIYDAGGKQIANGPLMDVAENLLGDVIFHFANSGGTYYFQLCDTNCKHTN